MAKIIVEIAGRRVYWELPEPNAIHFLQGAVQILGPADGDEEPS